MIGGKNQGSTRPTALGSLLQASTYGMTIPNIIGTLRCAFLAIWAANLRNGGSDKKGKKSKKGPPTYVENIDFLLGSNPILNVLQIWNNASRYPLDFLSVDFVGLIGGQDFAPYYDIADSNFYSIVGITFIPRGEGFGPFWVAGSFHGTFNDFGGQGPVPWSLTGQEIPMWNAFQPGPDVTNESGYRFAPLTYRWRPDFGNRFFLDEDISLNALLEGTLRVYYTARSTVIKHQTPLAHARLTFENELGNGPEFVGHEGQQIIYPQFAGCGSPDIDLGSSGAIPSLRPEVQGSYSFYSRGDADFTDMMETVIRSGVQHSGFELSELHRGVNCSNYPGPIQKKWYYQGEPGSRIIHTDYEVTQGNILFVYARCRNFTSTPSPQSISDSLGNSWILLFSGVTQSDGQVDVWYAIANSSGLDTITVTGGAYDHALHFCEMGGVDTIDDFQMFQEVGAPVVGTLNTTNDPTTPAVVMAFVDGSVIVQRPPTIYPHFWDELISNSKTEYVDSYVRTVLYPGPVKFSYSDTASGLFMIAFKNSGPAAYAKALGNILDTASIELTRAQCRAGGLWGSVDMDSQRKASEWLDDFATCANAVYVWSGDKLKVIPRSEVSATGNGAVYVSPTAAGPVFDLTERDFIGDSTTSPVVVTRTAQVDLPNILQIEHLDRNSDYNQCVTSQPDAGSVALYGPRKDPPQTLHMIMDPVIARKILAAQARRNANIRNTYSFKLPASFFLLEPMDLLSLTEPLLGLYKFPARLTSITENADFELDCVAEQFVYGVNALNDLTATAPQPNVLINTGIDGGSVNVPIIFEPVPRLTSSGIASELWMVVSSSNPNYGGSVAYVSTDGGLSYNKVAVILGNSVTGEVLVIPTPIVINNRGAGVTYSVTSADAGTVLQFPTSANVAVSLPDPTTLPADFTLFIFYGSDITLHSVPAGTLTITPAVDLINGAANFVMPGTPPNINWVVKITIGGAGYLAQGSGDLVGGSAVYSYVAAVLNTGGAVGWPAWSDPDSANDLFLDLTESNGELLSYAVQDEDNFTFPCYVSSDLAPTPTVAAGPQSYDSPNLCIPFNVPFGPGGTEFGLSIVRLRGAWVIYGANGGAAGTVSYDALGPCGGGTSFTLNAGTPPIGCGSCYGADKVPAFIFMGPVDRGLGFNYEFENVSLAFTNSGPIVGRARVDIPNGAPFGSDVVSLNGVTWPGGAGYVLGGAAVMIEMQPEHPGNPSLFIFMGIGQGFFPAPAGWTYVASGNYIQCYSQVASHGDPPDSKYELMTYAIATLTSPNKYELMATGGGNKLRRSVYGAPTPNFGVNHSPGTRFAFLNPSGVGMAKIPLDPRWIGVTLHFKFPSFNTLLGSPQKWAEATV
jgi:hypothetical protein